MGWRHYLTRKKFSQPSYKVDIIISAFKLSTKKKMYNLRVTS